MIELDEKYSIEVGRRSYNLVRKKTAKEERDKDDDRGDEHGRIGYYNSLSGALEAYCREKVRDGLENLSVGISEALSIVKEYEQSIKEHIRAQVPEVKIVEE